MSQAAHTAGAYPGFHSMKRRGICYSSSLLYNTEFVESKKIQQLLEFVFMLRKNWLYFVEKYTVHFNHITQPNIVQKLSFLYNCNYHIVAWVELIHNPRHA